MSVLLSSVTSGSSYSYASMYTTGAGVGESLTCNFSCTIESIKFYLRKFSSNSVADAYVQVLLYEAEPSGTPLATSSTVNLDDIPYLDAETWNEVEFTFSGTTELQPSTTYVVVLHGYGLNYGDTEGKNNIQVRYVTGSVHDGTMFEVNFENDTYSVQSPYDVLHEFYVDSSTVTIVPNNSAHSHIASSITISATITPTNTRHYHEIYNVDIKTAATVSAYAESNRNGYVELHNDNYNRFGQSFSVSSTTKLSTCQLYICKAGSPTGSAYAKIYAHTGTFGTSGKPTGAVLATSGSLSVSSLTSSYTLTTLTFSGSNQINLSSGTNYVLVLEWVGGDSSNMIRVGTDTTSPTAPGNVSYSYNGTDWGTASSYDIIHYVLGDNTREYIIAANIGHTHYASQPTVAQIQYVVPNNTTHTHLVSTGSILVILQPANTTHNHTISEIAISKIVVPSTILHTITLTICDITQTHTLATNNTIHTSTVVSTTLSQTHEIVPVSSIHSHYVVTTEVVEIAQPGNVTHEHTISQAVLEQEHTITTSNATHGHTVVSTTVGQEHTVIPNDCMHDHLISTHAEYLVIYGIHTDIFPEDCTHSHSVPDQVTLLQHFLIARSSLVGQTLSTPVGAADYQSVGGSTNKWVGQSFTPTKPYTTIYSITLPMATFLSEGYTNSGTVCVKLYTHTGTYGTTGIPGTLIATSDSILQSSIPNWSWALITFPFSSVNRVDLYSSTHYFFVVEYLSAVGGRSVGVMGSSYYGGTTVSSSDGTAWTVHSNWYAFSFDVIGSIYSGPLELYDCTHTHTLTSTKVSEIVITCADCMHTSTIQSTQVSDICVYPSSRCWHQHKLDIPTVYKPVYRVLFDSMSLSNDRKNLNYLCELTYNTSICGEGFQCTVNDCFLYSCTFSLSHASGPSPGYSSYEPIYGTYVTAKLFKGVYDTDYSSTILIKGTGEPLAVSNSVSLVNLPRSGTIYTFAPITFYFSGVNKYTLKNGEIYVIAVQGGGEMYGKRFDKFFAYVDVNRTGSIIPIGNHTETKGLTGTTSWGGNHAHDTICSLTVETSAPPCVNVNDILHHHAIIHSDVLILHSVMHTHTASNITVSTVFEVASMWYIDGVPPTRGWTADEPVHGGIAQCFPCNVGCYINYVKFGMYRASTAPDNATMVSKIYTAHVTQPIDPNWSYATDQGLLARPGWLKNAPDQLLAVSDPVRVDTLGQFASEADWVQFTFSGNNQVSLEPGKLYFASLEFYGLPLWGTIYLLAEPTGPNLPGYVVYPYNSAYMIQLGTDTVLVQQFNDSIRGYGSAIFDPVSGTYIGWIYDDDDWREDNQVYTVMSSTSSMVIVGPNTFRSEKYIPYRVCGIQDDIQYQVVQPYTISHTISIDPATIFRWPNAEPSNIFHIHTASTITLFVGASIFLPPIEHAHTITEPTFGQSHLLYVDDMLHTQSETSPIIVQEHYIQTTNVFHSISLEIDTPNFWNVELTFVQPDQSVMGITSSEPSIIQTHGVHVNNVTHTCYVDPAILAQVHILVCMDIYHAHTVSEPFGTIEDDAVDEIIAFLQEQEREIILQELQLQVKVIRWLQQN